jgi:hypothetical protein
MGYLGRNQQLWDLGIKDTKDIITVQRMVQQIDKDFDLVMITERFEESLILLSRSLCWPLANLTRSILFPNNHHCMLSNRHLAAVCNGQWQWAMAHPP